jgi:hypothetical protein
VGWENTEKLSFLMLHSERMKGKTTQTEMGGDTASSPGVGNLFMLEGRINLAVIK